MKIGDKVTYWCYQRIGEGNTLNNGKRRTDKKKMEKHPKGERVHQVIDEIDKFKNEWKERVKSW